MLVPKAKESGSVDRVAYEAAIAQRNRYREAHARLEHQVESLKAERDALREALENCTNTDDEYVYKIARAALERTE